MFTDEDKTRDHYPKVSGKGAEIKNLIWPLLHVWNEFKTDSDDDANVTQCLTLIGTVHDIIDAHSEEYFLPRKDAAGLYNYIEEFLDRYTEL